MFPPRFVTGRFSNPFFDANLLRQGKLDVAMENFLTFLKQGLPGGARASSGAGAGI
jgi:hypothetical protein